MGSKVTKNLDFRARSMDSMSLKTQVSYILVELRDNYPPLPSIIQLKHVPVHWFFIFVSRLPPPDARSPSPATEHAWPGSHAARNPSVGDHPPPSVMARGGRSDPPQPPPPLSYSIPTGKIVPRVGLSKSLSAHFAGGGPPLVLFPSPRSGGTSSQPGAGGARPPCPAWVWVQAPCLALRLGMQ
jgi:hypothetical protein